MTNRAMRRHDGSHAAPQPNAHRLRRITSATSVLNIHWLVPRVILDLSSHCHYSVSHARVLRLPSKPVQTGCHGSSPMHSADRQTISDARLVTSWLASSYRFVGRTMAPWRSLSTARLTEIATEWFHQARCRGDDGARGAVAERQRLFSFRVIGSPPDNRHPDGDIR